MSRAMRMGAQHPAENSPVDGNEEALEMLTKLGKAVLAAGCVTVAPLLLGSASDANAHTSVSGTISFGSPRAVAVLGFSNVNPYSYGHVHHEPSYCDEGPLYYYPAHHVYAHYYPRVRYYSYARPRYFYPRQHHVYPRHHAYPRHHYQGGHSRGYARDIRGHAPGRGNAYGGNAYGKHKSRGHYKSKSSYKVRGHGDRGGHGHR